MRVAVASRRDRIATLVGLALITGAAWVYIVHLARGMSMTGMSGIDVMDALTLGHIGVRFSMWAAMMIAMMVPTAAPMTLVYAAVARKAAIQDDPIAPTFVFVAGYAAVWTAFSLTAAVAQAWLEQKALLSPTMASSNRWFAAGVLIAAGAYQLLPIKDRCLAHCRAPAHFISSHWRRGTAGAFRMGLRHGAYCLGCCWVLMALLFVGGVMNLLLIAGLIAFIALEKLLPFGRAVGLVTGAAIILGGIVVLAV
jgi:predicted metal-binding membrane protein